MTVRHVINHFTFFKAVIILGLESIKARLELIGLSAA
jgi:hypothetical protein